MAVVLRHQLPRPHQATTVGAVTRNATDAELLDLDDVSVRTDEIRFELLDNTNQWIRDIHPEYAKASISNQTGQGIKRALSGVVIAPDEFDLIDVIAHRIRPSWILENGNALPLGIFLFADDRARRYSFGSIRDASLVDQGLILDQPPATSLGWAQGFSTRDAMIETAEAAGITDYEFDYTAHTLGTALTFPATQQNTYAKILDNLCGLAGFHPAYFDNSGRLRGRVVPDISVAVPTLVYGATTASGARVLSGSMVETSDLLTAPNQIRVVDPTVTEGGVVATYNIPDSAPHSIAKRGFAVPRILEAPGVGNADAALDFARAWDASTPKSYATVEFASPADPRHDTFDLITYRGETYVELGWTLALAAGGPMTHKAQRVYV